MSLRILQVGDCCAGCPQRLADAAGGDLVTFAAAHPFGYRAQREHNLNVFRNHAVISKYLALPRLLPIAWNYDLLHFHSFSVLPASVDLPFWRALGKKTILHYHGTEIRRRGYRHRCTPARGADRVVVSTPDLLRDVPDAEWIPTPVDTATMPYAGANRAGGPLRVLHAPSHPVRKGTAAVREGVRRAGCEIDWRCVTGQPHVAIQAMIREADVLIDQMNSYYGIYGAIAVEAMAAGKPVICSICEEYDGYYPGCPILPTRRDDPAEIARHLDALADGGPGYREELGLAGRRYVERVHGIDRVVRQLYGAGVRV